ncbi:MAG: alpha-L-fucosidase, partial [Kiritimatiellia bacterium]|nr:alpha-L-fucosidase [Kiritimatiellia bacterium]
AMPRDEFDPKEWADKFERGGFRVVVMHTKHHDGVCFFPSKYRTAQPERDFVGEFVAEAHRHGMYVVAYYSATPDAWSCQEHPDWSCVDIDGNFIELKWAPSPFGICCINNPGYRGFMLGQLEEIQKNCNTDGFWLDIYWNYSPCFCRHCRSKYAKASGGKRYEEDWKTDKGKLWQRDSFLELFRDIKRIAGHDGIERVVTYNMSGLSRELGYEQIDAECNTLSAEARLTIGKSLRARLYEHKSKAFEFFSTASPGDIGWTFKPLNLLLLEAAIVSAHGGSSLVEFDVKPSGYVSGYQMDLLGEVGKYLRARQEFLVDVEPVYDVGLLLAKGGTHDLDTKTSIRGGWAASLLWTQIPFAVLSPEADELSPYRVVILDEDFPMDEGFARKLKEYVLQGGNIIVVQNAAGMMEQDGEKFMLSELLGIECEGHTGFENVYLGGIDVRIASGLGTEPVRADGKAWRIKATTAEVLAYYVYPIARCSRERHLWMGPNPPLKEISKDPAVTLNRVGKGKAVYIGCPVNKFGGIESPLSRELIQLGRNLVPLLIEEPLLRSESPSAVEVVVNRQGNRHIIHFLNHYVDMSSFYDRPHTVPRLSNVSVWINQNRIGPVKKVFQVPDMKEMELETNGVWVRVAPQELNIHEMFVLAH